MSSSMLHWASRSATRATLRCVLCLLLICAGRLTAAQPAVVIEAGDRVLLIGDTLFEREGHSAAFETLMYRHFAPALFTVRNLSYSADRPNGVSRASFDGADVGPGRIKEQLDRFKPTVAIIGYGMAASLEELTYASNDPTLNPDPGRYGTDFTSTRFQRDLEALMDMISASSGVAVRFVLVAPIRHEDLRDSRPGLPDPSEHQRLLTAYVQAIRAVAIKHSAVFIDTPALIPASERITDNGIHPSTQGMERWAHVVAGALGWDTPGKRVLAAAQVELLRGFLQRKNDLFFHRWRPSNQTYLLGFRSGEQGKNAVELGQFDLLISQCETRIAAVMEGRPTEPLPVRPAIPAALDAVPAPDLHLADGMEISLWAQNPQVDKPIHMAWDGKGRLWVTSSPIYPQILPGAIASDRIFILGDPQHSGHATQSMIFADDLEIPSGIAPVDRADGHAEAYVSASTELLLLSSNRGDGKANRRRIVLSGFGTEDTHHCLHTLYWGKDGRLYFDQSIYIHSHLETPWGVVRLNGGGVFAYDPARERVEVFIKGLWNPWGHQMDGNGQSFLTDGAGFTGLTWGFPGSVFSQSEGSTVTMPSCSAGSYPKFCSLALIDSPLFPATWQGNVITADFRAHRVVRMAITDLDASSPQRSGFATTDQPDLITTGDAFFRPIDLKFGPDGALYIADWTNQIINHGEVDFRDKRRDKDHGRIWRVAMKGSTPLAWTSLYGRSISELCRALGSPNYWEHEHARQVLSAHCDTAAVTKLLAWVKEQATPTARRDAAFVLESANRGADAMHLLDGSTPVLRALEARWAGQAVEPQQYLSRLVALANDSDPRVRIEAMRALARVPVLAAANAVIAAAMRVPNDDQPYAFAVAKAMETQGPRWLAAVVDGSWDPAGREDQLERGLLALPAASSASGLQHLFAARSTLVKPPWPNLIARVGGSTAVGRLFAECAGLHGDDLAGGLQACADAAARGVVPPGSLAALALPLGDVAPSVRRAAARLAGLWHRADLVEQLRSAASDVQTRGEALAALQAIGGAAADQLAQLVADGDPDLRHRALEALAHLNGDRALALALPLIKVASSVADATLLWNALWPAPGMLDKVAKNLPADLPALAISAGIASARQQGDHGNALVQALTKALPAPAAIAAGGDKPKDLAGWVALARQSGDPVKGQAIFLSPAAMCTQCHAIGGAGGRLGPDLTTLGASAPLDYIVESVLVPAAKVKEGYNAVSYRMKDGSTIVGIPYAESAREWRIHTLGNEQGIAKDQVVGRDMLGTLMPPGLIDALPVSEQANLFAFLGALGKPGAWDASDGRIARIWRLSSDVVDAGAAGGIGHWPAVFAQIDGHVPKGAWSAPLAALTGNGPIYASAQFDTASAGLVTVQLAGASWIHLDGTALDPSKPERILPAGQHMLTVRVERDAIPTTLRASVSTGRFITP